MWAKFASNKRGHPQVKSPLLSRPPTSVLPTTVPAAGGVRGEPSTSFTASFLECLPYLWTTRRTKADEPPYRPPPQRSRATRATEGPSLEQRVRGESDGKFAWKTCAGDPSGVHRCKKLERKTQRSAVGKLLPSSRLCCEPVTRVMESVSCCQAGSEPAMRSDGAIHRVSPSKYPPVTRSAVPNQ